ncbi:HEAT repeat domain-containing protein [Streptomyces sp. NPDC005892]|uniref:HEAT repeat domain-containing protein n=1 Tax=Streptomyces sp. NPDC005892 TaxID=3155593 RepID=UPI0033D3CD35
MRKPPHPSPTRPLAPHERLVRGNPPATAVDTADPEAWIDHDRRVRATTARGGASTSPGSGTEGPGAEVLGPGDRAFDPQWDEGARDVTWTDFPPTEPETALALCHHRWQVREAAVPFAAGRPALLPLLLLRCADGRAPVRERARRTFGVALDGPGAAERAAALVPLAVQLALRPHGGPGLALVLAAAPALPSSLPARLLASPRPRARLLGVGLCLHRGLLPPARLTELILTAEDPAVRRLCTDALLARVSAGDPHRLLDPLLIASSAATRSSAVTALHRAGRGPEALGHLADPSARVRTAARLVARLEGADPWASYRERCADPVAPALPPGAVFGLAESRAPDAAGLLRPLTRHPEGRVRAAALAGLRMLDAVSIDELMAAMDDPHPPVVRTARKALTPYVLLVPEEWLAALVNPARPTHVRRAGLRLLGAHSLGLRKRVLAGMEEDQDAEVAHEAQRARYEPLPPA